MEFATVDDVIEILKKVSSDGFGSYEVSCNDEYALAIKGELPEINMVQETVNLGGYC